MIVDVSTFVGPYPYRHLSDTSCDGLLRHLERLQISEAWVGHLPSFLYRDPAAGNEALRAMVADHPRLRPVPAIHPDLPDWEADLAGAVEASPAVRAYPMHWGLDPAGPAMQELAGRVGTSGRCLLLTVRFEDGRQRHRLDTAADLPPSAVRALARTGEEVRLVVAHADRAFIEETHYGLTEAEAERILWDISWIWGPPTADLAHLVATLGEGRFVFGTGMPLRIPDATVAKLDLLDLSAAQRGAIESHNIRQWAR